MARKYSITRQNLGIALLIGLAIGFVFPMIGLGKLTVLSTVIYLIVAIYLLIGR